LPIYSAALVAMMGRKGWSVVQADVMSAEISVMGSLLYRRIKKRLRDFAEALGL